MMSRIDKVPTPKKSPRWSDIKAALDGCDRNGLIGLLRDLYEASETNRRFLHARYASSAGVLEDYRRRVSQAVAPDPFSRQPVRLRDATAAITEYRRATGDVAGCVDLMLEFVEAGTAQTADVGGGDDAYFSALERKVREVMRALGDLADTQRAAAIDRLIQLGQYGDQIGWGYGDFLLEMAAKLQKRQGVQGICHFATRSNNALEPSARRRS
jgi:hypothetical protein